MTDQTAFGEYLRRRRGALELTREALARRAHCSASSLRRLEAGDLRPSRDLAQTLAAALEIPLPQHAAFVQFARGESTTFDLPPAPGAPPAAAAPPLNLPAPLTSFVGRRRETAALGRLLAEPDVRLVSLTGPPGTGKTRLSLAVAQQAAPAFPDGVYFVPLAPLREPALVLPLIAHTLGLREPAGGAEVLRLALREALRPKRLLLVLDNFEHLVEAGPLLTDLLSAAPGLKALVTSREPLHLYGEHEFPVPPLELPDVRRLPSPQAYTYYARYAALQLFQQRARAVQPGFKLTIHNAPDVARICAWLDGLPLAIEMAAAQVKWLPTEQLFQQLSRRLETLTGGPRDLSPRQQSLAGAIDWSYHLLSPAEQHLFNHLGVFVGGCDAAAAGAVAGMSSVAPGLQTLVEKSLLRYLPPAGGEARYELLESLREYALERLEACGELAAARAAHARHYAALAQTARPHLLVGGDQQTWLNRLETEHDNLRAALAWSIATSGQAGFALELAEAMGHFWNVRGYVSEARAGLQQVLALEAEPSPLRGSALNEAGWLAQLQGDYDAARALHQQALALHQALG
ncbi:MAG: helix-turn-helix domain-containing protein, partial [Anaerolineales bacterium]